MGTIVAGGTEPPKDPGANERRVALRRSVVDSHLITVDLAFQSGALLLDLSETGMGVQALASAPTGTATPLNFELPETGGRVEGLGRIAWTDSSGRVGIRFEEIAELGRMHLAQWLAHDRRSLVAPGPNMAAPSWPPPHTHDEIAALRRDLTTEKLTGDPALAFIMERMRSVTRATGAAIALESGGEVLCRASSGNAPGIGARVDSNSGLSGECMRTGEIVRCEDTETDPRADRLVCRRLELRSIVIVPVRVQGRPAGVLEAFSSRAHAFQSSDVLLLRRLSDLVAGVVLRQPEAAPDRSSVMNSALLEPFSPELMVEETTPPMMDEILTFDIDEVAPPLPPPQPVTAKPQPAAKAPVIPPMPPQVAVPAPRAPIVEKPAAKTPPTTIEVAPVVAPASKVTVEHPAPPLATPEIPLPVAVETAPVVTPVPSAPVERPAPQVAAPVAKPPAPIETPPVVAAPVITPAPRAPIERPVPPVPAPIAKPEIPAAKPEIKTITQKPPERISSAVEKIIPPLVASAPPVTSIPEDMPQATREMVALPPPVTALDFVSPRAIAAAAAAASSAVPVRPRPTPVVQPVVDEDSGLAPLDPYLEEREAAMAGVPRPGLSPWVMRTTGAGILIVVLLVGGWQVWRAIAPPRGTPMDSELKQASPASPPQTSAPAPLPAAIATPTPTTPTTAPPAAKPVTPPSTSAAAKSTSPPPAAKNVSNEAAPKPIVLPPPQAAQSESDAPPSITIAAARPAGEPSAISSLLGAPVAAPVLKVSQMSGGKLIKKFDPVYPSGASGLRLHGEVVLKATISREGKVIKVQIVRGPGQLAQAAAAAVRRWRYEPFVLNGIPIQVENTIIVNFKAPGSN